MLKWLARIPNRPIMWMATILHLFWAIGLILIPQKVATTTGLFPFSDYPRQFGLLFMVSGVMALHSLIREVERGPSAVTFWLFIPQQALLMVSAGSVLAFAFSGHFADGTVVPGGSWFIFMDQLPKVLLAVLHPFGLLRMHLSILPRKRINGGTEPE